MNFVSNKSYTSWCATKIKVSVCSYGTMIKYLDGRFAVVVMSHTPHFATVEAHVLVLDLIVSSNEIISIFDRTLAFLKVFFFFFDALVVHP